MGVNFVSSPSDLNYKTIAVNSFSKDVYPINLFLHLTKDISNSILNLKERFIYKNDRKFLQNFKDFGKFINIKKNEEIIKGIFFGLGNNGEIILKKDDKLNFISYGEVI
ncbi:MAG: hypothetical protein CL572_02005 [Alphaproteobacteria bacterium]|nr:hypothetical protein [Alphaproteobacteria bacterium]